MIKSFQTPERAQSLASHTNSSVVGTFYSKPSQVDFQFSSRMSNFVKSMGLLIRIVQMHDYMFTSIRWILTVSFVEIIGEAFIKEELNLFVYCLVVCACSAVSGLDCSLSGFFVHGISQARVLEWVAISSSRGPSWPRDWILDSCIASLPLSHLGIPHILVCTSNHLRITYNTKYNVSAV